MSSYNRRIKKDLNDNHTRRRAGVNTPSNRRNFFFVNLFPIFSCDYSDPSDSRCARSDLPLIAPKNKTE